MTTTSQPPEPDKDAVSPEPTNEASESKKDAQGVPVGEHVQLRQELRAAKEQLEQLKAAQAPKPAEPKEPVIAQASDGDLAKTVQELKQWQRVQSLASELGVTEKQGEAVAEVLAANPSLNPVEAKFIAVSRNSDLFAEVDAPGGFDPGTHGVMRPRSVSQQPEPQQSDFKNRMNLINGTLTTNKARSTQLWNNLVGKFAAESVGRDHTLIPIPKKP